MSEYVRLSDESITLYILRLERIMDVLTTAEQVTYRALCELRDRRNADRERETRHSTQYCPVCVHTANRIRRARDRMVELTTPSDPVSNEQMGCVRSARKCIAILDAELGNAAMRGEGE